MSLRQSLVAAAFCTVLSAVSAAERVALVIGNDLYEHTQPLKAAVNDAEAVAALLGKLDFKVITVLNAGLEDMLEKLGELQAEAAGADAVLVYYAGHGIESKGGNYLIPVDAKLEKEIHLKIQTVSVDSVLDGLKQLQVPARIVILDCCRNNPLEGRSWLATRGSGGLAALSQDSLSEATLVVYSASPGKPALDRVSSSSLHSPFATALLEQLPKPGMHSFETFGMVEDAVIQSTAGRQAPRLFYNGSTQPFRNFRFAAATAAAGGLVTPPAPASPPMTASADIQLPPKGYFDVEEIFQGSPYAGYNSHSQREILRRVQQQLKTLGHLSGSADGAMGPATQQAILVWQQSGGLAATGRLNPDSLAALRLTDIGEMTAPPKPRIQRPATPKKKFITTPSGASLDVSGFASGTKVRHPVTGEIVYVP